MLSWLIVMARQYVQRAEKQQPLFHDSDVIWTSDRVRPRQLGHFWSSSSIVVIPIWEKMGNCAIFAFLSTKLVVYDRSYIGLYFYNFFLLVAVYVLKLNTSRCFAVYVFGSVPLQQSAVFCSRKESVASTTRHQCRRDSSLITLSTFSSINNLSCTSRQSTRFIRRSSGECLSNAPTGSSTAHDSSSTRRANGTIHSTTSFCYTVV